jgi:hypothetical protein
MHRVSRAVAYLVLLSVVSLVLAASASAQTKLQWKFQPGQVLQQTITQEMSTTATIQGQEIKTKVDQVVDAVWNIKAVDADGTAIVTQEITRMRMKMDNTAGMGFDFDSEEEAEPTGIGAAFFPALRAVASSKFTLKMKPTGEILEVDVSEDTLKALTSFPGADQMGGALTKDGLIHMIKQGSPAMPDGPVQPGQTWKNAMEMAMGPMGQMSIQTLMTYAGSEQVNGRQLERIDMNVQTTMVPQEGGAISMELKDQKATGSLFFDNQAGRISHSNLVQNMTMAMSIGGQKFDQQVTQVVKVEVKPVP